MSQDKLRLLLIDDSLADARLFKALLDQARPGEIELVHSEDAAQGLELLQDLPFDCVFLDYMLGEMNGLDVLRAIRTSGNDLPIIALSGCGTEAVAVEALKLGAQDYLVKGALSPQAVERALNNAIEKVSLARQLAERQSDLTDFAYVAAHDLKAPLRRIAAYAKWVVDESSDAVAPEVLNKLNTICLNADRMQQFVTSLLEFTRVGRSNAPLKPVELDALLPHVMANLEAVIREERATVHVEALPIVVGNSVTLVQVFQNLIGNAIKFHGEDPPVVTVSAEASGGEWIIKVADQGIGIEAEFQEDVFSPFHRLHTQEEYEGSGIGLATCKRVIDQHGGRVWVESEFGRGSTFYFTLAAAESSECREAAAGSAVDRLAVEAPATVPAMALPAGRR